MNNIKIKLIYFILIAFISVTVNKLCFSSSAQNIQLEKKRLISYLSRLESKETGLYQSYTNSAHYVEDIYTSPPRFMETLDGYLDNQAFVYDQGLALIALIHAGKYDKARYLLNVFEDNFETEKNGRIGLLNAYLLSNFDYFIPTASGKKQLMCMGIDGDRIHIGPNMWIGFGALQYYAHTGSPEFLPFALKMFLWARSLNHYPMPDGTAGGVSMGFGWGTEWNRVFSTENNIDYYVLIDNLIKIYTKGNPYIQKIFASSGIELQDLVEEKKNIQHWMQKVGFNHTRGTFNRGANPINDPDIVEALDCTSWSIAGFGPKNMEKMGFDLLKLIKESEKKFLVEDQMAGKDFKGFDYTDLKGHFDKRHYRVIWFEGTAQMALTYQILSKYYYDKGDLKLAKDFEKRYFFFLKEIEKVMTLDNFKDYGLPTTTRFIDEKEMSHSFSDWWPIIRTEKGKHSISLSSTLWRYFAVTGFNPFEIKIPEKTIQIVDTLDTEETKDTERQEKPDFDKSNYQKISPIGLLNPNL